MESIEQRFIAGCADAGVMARSRVVVAISGGGDSCALLALLCETGVVPRDRIVAAYFDHRLRGDEAAREERRAVGALCARYGVRLEVAAWDAPMAREAAARKARYAFLAEAAREHRADAVLTGHTQDDQVETVLMHALRGAGLYGLAGIAVHASWPFAEQQGPAVVRPLLKVTRGETRAYCGARRIAYVDDPSNDDRSYLRNRVRHDLLPVVDAMMPEGRTSILRLAGEARAGVDAIAPVVDAIVDGDADGHVRMSRAALRSLAPELLPHAYRRGIVRLLGDAREFERRHYAILSRCHDAATGATLQLPRGVVATVDADAVLLSLGALPVPSIDPAFERALPFAGVVGAWRIDVARAGDGEAIVLPEAAVVRGRRSGDRIAPRGMRGHKKLQDYYVDKKVPRRERDAAPVIADGGDVLWTPFGAARGVDDGAPFVVGSMRVAAT